MPHSIALILQLSLKETYIPDVPFFLLDDVAEDFDPDRRNVIFNYLKDKAEENDWFVVVTKVREDVEKPTIKLWR